MWDFNPSLSPVEAVKIDISFPVHRQLQPGKVLGRRAALGSAGEIKAGVMAPADEGVILLGFKERPSPVGAD